MHAVYAYTDYGTACPILTKANDVFSWFFYKTGIQDYRETSAFDSPPYLSTASRVTNKPVGMATELPRTLPASWYTSQELYNLERRAVFFKVCLARQLRHNFSYNIDVSSRGISLDQSLVFMKIV